MSHLIILLLIEDDRRRAWVVRKQNRVTLNEKLPLYKKKTLYEKLPLQILEM